MTGEDDQELESGRICPVYALAPMRIMGLSSGSAMVALLVFGGGYFVLGALYAAPLAFLVAYVSEKASGGRENAFAVQWVSAHAKGMFAKILAESWGNLGLIAPPNYQNTYEP